MNVVVMGVPNPDPISQCIINGNTDEFRERYFGQVERDEAILYDLLLLAIKYGHENIVRLICQQSQIDLNRPDAFGNTPMMIAAQHKQYSVIKLLIQSYGSMLKLYARNQVDRTMVDYLPRWLVNDKQALLNTCGVLSLIDLKGAICDLEQFIENKRQEESVMIEIIAILNYVLDANLTDPACIGMLILLNKMLIENREAKIIYTISGKITELIDTALEFEQYRFTDVRACQCVEKICEEAFIPHFMQQAELREKVPAFNLMLESQQQRSSPSI